MVERVLARTRPAQDVDQGKGNGGCRRDGPGAAGRDDQVGRWPVVPFRGPFLEATQRCPGGGHPERDAVARRVGPGRQAQLAQAIAQAMPVGAPGGPQADPVDDRIVGIEVRQRRTRDDGKVQAGRPARDPGRRRRACPRIEADLDDVDPPVEHLGQRDRPSPERAPGVVGREGQLDEQLGERTGRHPAVWPRARAGPRRRVSRCRRTPLVARSSRRRARPSGPAAGQRQRRPGRPARRGRAVRPRRADRSRRRARTRRPRRGASWSSPADRSIRRSLPRSASRSARPWRRAVRAPVPRRRPRPSSVADGSRPRAAAGPWRPRAGGRAPRRAIGRRPRRVRRGPRRSPRRPLRRASTVSR